jgi:hypothetical protein
MSRPPPSVSIIIPALNCAATLETCLSSIVNSTFRDYEIIVVDGQSSDRTQDIARHYAHQLLIPSTNRERGDARNHGIRAATGEILVFTDADNVMKPNTLSVIVDYLTRHPATVGKTRHRFRPRLARPIGERYLNSAPCAGRPPGRWPKTSHRGPGAAPARLVCPQRAFPELSGPTTRTAFWLPVHPRRLPGRPRHVDRHRLRPVEVGASRPRKSESGLKPCSPRTCAKMISESLPPLVPARLFRVPTQDGPPTP